MFFLLAVLVTAFACNKCEDPILTPCGGNADKPAVDLIILMDQSGSMGAFADSISAAASQGISRAQLQCDTDLRVQFLGVDGVNFPGTSFTTSHRTYLNTLAGTSLTLAGDVAPIGYQTEQGANAIEDLSEKFDWRPDACRAIFYISDEELDGCCPFRIWGSVSELSNETNEVNSAITAAQNNSVAVFSHLIDYGNLSVEMFNLYQKLSDQTGGTHIKSSPAAVTKKYYESLLPDIICNACNGCTLNSVLQKSN